nr:hypothetical protein [Kibdelosporangium sp. MJ126-NF4]CEL22847.1 hypothetical protein [Kibdelosporangium sp. MJ126-NF4]CTQ89987.1 hypothetical protein [Kibdelosporangium sp. MJ126-NF4]
MGDDRECRALLVNGTVGVGKTSVAEAVGDLLANASIPHAVIDLDWLSNRWPSPPDDRFNFDIQLRNLRSVARNYLDGGARLLVLAGVVETRADRRRYAEAIGVDLVVCRLVANLTVVHQRLTRRHGEADDDLKWHLHRSGELDDILDRADVDDCTVPADGPLPEVAKAVTRSAGWL